MYGLLAAGIAAGAQMTASGVSNALSWKITKAQMKFQHYMSGTAYQRAVNDLELAGLNPILLAGGPSPASTPPGARTDINLDSGGNVFASALAMDKVRNETALIRKQAKTQEALATAAGEQARRDRQHGEYYKAMAAWQNAKNPLQQAISQWIKSGEGGHYVKLRAKSDALGVPPWLLPTIQSLFDPEKAPGPPPPRGIKSGRPKDKPKKPWAWLHKPVLQTIKDALTR